MQIRKLIINNYKCLQDFSIEFSISRDAGSSTILIGQNGTGKSTFMDKILEILMSFSSDSIEEKIRYDYELEYFYKGSDVRICRTGTKYTVEIDQEKKCTGIMKTVRNHIKKGHFSLLPERICYFYSGINNKALTRYERLDSSYQAECIATVVEYWRAVVWAGQEYTSHFPKRRYNYCDDSLTEMYLISILGGNASTEKEYLFEQCQMSGLSSLIISIDVDKMLKSLADDATMEDISWFYEIAEFIDQDLTQILREGYLSKNGHILYFQLRNTLDFGMDSISVFNYFEKLSTVFSSRYDVFIQVGNAIVNSKDLSEGQRQLIKILGMLGVCNAEDCLVLMDEPDAHMNPKWKYELKKTIDLCLEEAVNTQAIIATHDPLVINGVDKEHIRIFELDKVAFKERNIPVTKIFEPTEDTSGMGIDGLLQSQYYGLQTSYDKKATDKFKRRQELYIKLINNEIEETEKEELRALTKEIGSFHMSYNSIDFLYDDFIRVFRKHPLYAKEYLSYDQIIERRKHIEEIIRVLYEQ